MELEDGIEEAVPEPSKRKESVRLRPLDELGLKSCFEYFFLMLGRIGTHQRVEGLGRPIFGRRRSISAVQRGWSPRHRHLRLPP